MKKLEEVKLDSKENNLVNASAQCMLDLLHARFFNENLPEFLKDDNLDIDFDFSLFGDETIEEKNAKGYTNKKYSESADNYVRRL